MESTARTMAAKMKEYKADLLDGFDLDKYCCEGDKRDRIIRCHILCEFLLSSLIDDAVKNKDLMNIERISFVTKIEIAASFALIPATSVSPLRKLNSLRNKVAHKLDDVVRDKEIRDFENTMPQEGRKIVTEILDGTIERGMEYDGLGALLLVTIILTEANRQDFVARKTAELAAMERLRTALDALQPRLAAIKAQEK